MRNKFKVVIDTNIFLHSWFEDDENCNYILNLASKRKILLQFSQDTIGELIYIIKKYAIKNMSSQIPRIKLLNNVAELFYWSDSVDTSETDCPKINDKTDEMFLKCAIEGKADYLISNDFRSGMHEIEGLDFNVLSPEDFINTYISLAS